MRKNNRTCICCGTKYTYCSGCSEYDHLPRWMSIYHDANCREIFTILMDYEIKEITKEQAVERLHKCNLSKRKTFNEKIRNEIEALLKVESKSASTANEKNKTKNNEEK